MTQSAMLRARQTAYGGGKTIFSAGAKEIEANLSQVLPHVIERLKEEHPDANIQWHKNILKTSDYYDLGDYTLQNKRAAIKPDGGMITFNGTPIFFGEVKNQGTNHLRIKEGLSRQAMGNGIERIYKNIVEIQHIMKDYSFMPYAIFVQGSDFHEGSAMVDRLSMLSPFNTLRVANSHQPSVFLKINPSWDIDPELWAAEEIYGVCYDICKSSIDCIL